MELKPAKTALAGHNAEQAFNRTSMELKPGNVENLGNLWYAFNRTSMELKLEM